MDLKKLEKLLDEWHVVSKQAAMLVEQERSLRAKIFELAFPTPTPGTNKVKISHGMALIGDYRINYKIDRPALESSRGFIPADTFEKVVNYRPEIRDGAYRKLTDEERKLFASFVTETPGTPGLDLKPQSKVRW